MIIRSATLFDLEPLWYMFMSLTRHETNEEAKAARQIYPRVSNLEKDQWALQTVMYLTNPDVLFQVAEKDGLLKGFMLSSVGQRTVGQPRAFLNVHQLYVDPAERRCSGGNAAPLLIKGAETWAKSLELKHAEISCVQSNVSRWERFGFTPVAVHMQKEI